MRPLHIFLLNVSLIGPATAWAEPVYPWLAAPRPEPSRTTETLQSRFAPPPGAHRVPVAPGSFGEWLRGLPLRPAGSPVLLFNGKLKPRQDVHAAVVDIDVGNRDLQQCADAVMRLRAEYLYSTGRPVRFHPDPGKPRALEFTSGPRDRFGKYLVRVFADAGSASLQAELNKVGDQPVQPGDVFIQGGYPGHAVIVLDAAEDGAGHRFVLVGQSYMPAQQFHVLKNPASSTSSPWYEAADLASGLKTPEWAPFTRRDVRRFPGD